VTAWQSALEPRGLGGVKSAEVPSLPRQPAEIRETLAQRDRSPKFADRSISGYSDDACNMRFANEGRGKTALLPAF